MTTRWTQFDINNLPAGMVKDFTHQAKNRCIVIEVLKKGCPIKTRPLEDMKFILRSKGIKFQTEYKFLSNRKFRFDIYLEVNSKRIGVEYDGLISTKSRHTTITGFSLDTIKMNLAAMNGFIVLRYTILTYKNFINDINFLLQCGDNKVG